MSIHFAIDELIVSQLSLLDEMFESVKQTQRMIWELRHQRLLHRASLIVLSFPPVNDQVIAIEFDIAFLQLSEIGAS